MWGTRWSEFPEFSAEMGRLRNEMERVFGRTDGRRIHAAGYPPLNVWDDDENIYVESEIPGIDINELVIFVNGDDQFSIQGERKQPVVEEGKWHRQERSYGKFSRIVQLPNEVDVEHVSAAYAEGILLITLPKKEAAKPRRIDIQAAK